jgi:DNA repair protein SbcD/Mre11
VALGHLHRPQEIDGHEHIAYSGSPLPYSFSEDHPKSVRVIEIEEGEIRDIQIAPIPIGRPVVTLTDTLDNLISDEKYDVFLDYWIAVRLTDEVPRVQPMERLRQRFPYVVSVRSDRSHDLARSILRESDATAQIREPEEIVLDFLQDALGRRVDTPEEELVLQAVAGAKGGIES